MGTAEVKSSRRKKSSPSNTSPSTPRSSPPSAAVDGESPAVDGAQPAARGKAVGTRRAMRGGMSKQTKQWCRCAHVLARELHRASVEEDGSGLDSCWWDVDDGTRRNIIWEAERALNWVGQCRCRTRHSGPLCPLATCLTEAAQRGLEEHDLGVLQDILSLVDREVPVEALRTWTPEQREQAEKWAAKLHLRASDNPVRVPPEPEHVAAFDPRRTAKASSWVCERCSTRPCACHSKEASHG